MTPVGLEILRGELHTVSERVDQPGEQQLPGGLIVRDVQERAQIIETSSNAWEG
jgi:hypothetical protein